MKAKAANATLAKIFIEKIDIKNFRSINAEGINAGKGIDAKDFSLFVGDNGTAKTTILEAIHFALSPNYLSGKIKNTDFYKGTDEPIEITITFNRTFKAKLPDGYITQEVECNGIYLKIKKRDKASPGKLFSDPVTITHYVVPIADKDQETGGWKQQRKKESYFRFTERDLVYPNVELEGFCKCFYFNKNRDRQLQKGFNSSLSQVLEDLNWRFLKSLRKSEPEKTLDNYCGKKNQFEKEILSRVNDSAIDKSLAFLNAKLNEFDLPSVELSLIDGQAPFSTAFFSQKINEMELPVSDLGSGIEMITSLLFLETLSSSSHESIILLIDEPELHLHPSLQEKFADYLMKLSQKSQIFISTHSPYFYKNCRKNQNDDKVEFLISKKNKERIQITKINGDKKLFKWSPSWGEINFNAYGMPTIEFHNELYGALQEDFQKYRIKEFEDFLVENGEDRSRKWKKLSNGELKPAEDVTLMTYIRNVIHHPENIKNGSYTQEELKESIEKMIKLRKKQEPVGSNL